MLPSLAGLVVFSGLRVFIGYHQAVNMDMLPDPQSVNFAFGFISFLFGFLPCFLYARAVSYMANLRGSGASVDCPEIGAVTGCELPGLQPLELGQVFTYAGANCRLRVKAIKEINAFNLLEGINPGYLDYM